MKLFSRSPEPKVLTKLMNWEIFQMSEMLRKKVMRREKCPIKSRGQKGMLGTEALIFQLALEKWQVSEKRSNNESAAAETEKIDRKSSENRFIFFRLWAAVVA